MAAERTSHKDTSSARDFSLWALALLVLAAGIVGYNYYADQVMTLVRVIGLLAAAGIALFLFGRTLKGRELFAFFKEADLERRKVVWPTRQETLQTSMVVFVLVLLLGVILFFLDRFWGFVVRSLIGAG